jgi:hypothetical protein
MSVGLYIIRRKQETGDRKGGDRALRESGDREVQGIYEGIGEKKGPAGCRATRGVVIDSPDLSFFLFLFLINQMDFLFHPNSGSGEGPKNDQMFTSLGIKKAMFPGRQAI